LRPDERRPFPSARVSSNDGPSRRGLPKRIVQGALQEELKF